VQREVEDLDNAVAGRGGTLAHGSNDERGEGEGEGEKRGVAASGVRERERRGELQQRRLGSLGKERQSVEERERRGELRHRVFVRGRGSRG
jgi:hypothetical protein